MPSPIPGPPPFATSTVAGLVSIVSQQFQGPKEFLGKIQLTGNPIGLGSFTTGTEPTPASHTGSLLYNTTLNRIRYSNGAAWSTLDIGVGSYVLTTGDTMTGTLTITGAGLVVDSADNTLVVDPTTNRVGILTASPTVPLDVAGAARITGQLDLGTGVANTKLLIATGHGFGFQTNDFRAHLSGAGSKFAWYDTAAAATPLMFLQGNGDLSVDGTTLYVDAVNNRVGILTTTPSFPLQVAGIIYSSSGGVRYPDNVTQTVAFLPSSYVARSGDTMTGGLVVDSGDNTFVVDAVVNKVAIGHNAPSRVFDIRSALADHLVQFQNTDVTGASSATFQSNGGTERFRLGYANPSFAGITAGLNFLHTDAATSLIVAHGGVEFHRFVASTGNVIFDVVDNTLAVDTVNNRVGFGTATPASGYQTTMSATTGLNGSVLKILNNSVNGYGGIDFYNAGSYQGSLGWGGSGVTAGGTSQFTMDIPTAFHMRSGVTTYHHFLSNGHIALDQVDNGLVLDATNNRIAFGTSSFTSFGGFAHPFVMEMGAGNKTSLIRGVGTIRKGLSIADTTNNRTWTWDHATSANNNRFEMWYHNGTSEARILTLTTDGKLGVNNTTPSVELDVVGSGQLSGGLTVDTNTLVVDATNNNVGVGTTPAVGIKLDVNGVIRGTNVWVPSYSSLYENGAGTAITITTAATYYQWVSTTVGEEAGAPYAVASAASDNITIGTGGPGKYRVGFTVSLSATANAIVIGAIHKNGTITVAQGQTKVGNATDRIDMTGGAIVTLASTDTIDLRFTSDTNGDVVTVYNVSLILQRIA